VFVSATFLCLNVMTTAHKPQVSATRGGGNNTISFGGYFTGGHKSGSKHGRDMPNHTVLKFRQPGQQSQEEIRNRAEQLRQELEERERAHFEQIRKAREKKIGVAAAADGHARSSSAMVIEDEPAARSSRGAGSVAGSTKSKPTDDTDAILAAFDDADEDHFGDAAQESEEEDEDEDEDDTEALMREVRIQGQIYVHSARNCNTRMHVQLDRIRKEREADRLRKEAEAAALAEKESTEAILAGNPLLMKGTAATLGSVATCMSLDRRDCVV
jgi:protein CWC15